MPKFQAWTRNQLLIAVRLYMRLPFGRLHGRNPEIVDLADKIGRTPAALAMKACNFASLDPQFRATNRRGLSGASDADRALWNEFAGDAEQVAAQIEEAYAALEPAKASEEVESIQAPAGDTDAWKLVRVRRVQSFFRAAGLTSYGSRCAISGLAAPELLNASHIIPWGQSVERRGDPTNGICFNALFDRAFDRGLLTIDERYRVVVSARLDSAAGEAELGCSLREAHGRFLREPSRLRADAAALAHHRERIFVG